MSLLDLLPPPWALVLLITIAVWYYWDQIVQLKSKPPACTADKTTQTGQTTQADKKTQTGKTTQADRTTQTGKTTQADKTTQAEKTAQAEKNPQVRLLNRRPVDIRVKCIRMVMIGKTGAGKSATGNSIIGRPDAFKPKRAWKPETELCRRAAVVINGLEIQIVDTPGVLDMERSPEDVEREITKCICLSSPGPHIFIMTIRLDQRFTTEEYTAYEMLKNMFGKKVVDYMVIVFTNGDQLEDMNIQQMIERAPESLKTVVKEVKNRYVVFNNKAEDDETQDAQVFGLLGVMEDLISGQVETFFTNEQTQKAERYLEEKIREIMTRDDIAKREARKILMHDIEHNKEPSFLSNVASAIGMAALITEAVGLACLKGGASLAALALAAGGHAATGIVVTAATLAPSSVALAEAAKRVGKKVCSVM